MHTLRKIFKEIKYYKFHSSPASHFMANSTDRRKIIFTVLTYLTSYYIYHRTLVAEIQLIKESSIMVSQVLVIVFIFKVLIQQNNIRPQCIIMSCIKFTYSEEFFHIFPVFRQRSLLSKNARTVQSIGLQFTMAQR